MAVAQKQRLGSSFCCVFPASVEGEEENRAGFVGMGKEEKYLREDALCG